MAVWVDWQPATWIPYRVSVYRRLATVAKPFKGGTYPRLSRGIVHFFSAPEMFKENTRL
jgi:hypothetical protein